METKFRQKSAKIALVSVVCNQKMCHVNSRVFTFRVRELKYAIRISREQRKLQ